MSFDAGCAVNSVYPVSTGEVTYRINTHRLGLQRCYRKGVVWREVPLHSFDSEKSSSCKNAVYFCDQAVPSNFERKGECMGLNIFFRLHLFGHFFFFFNLVIYSFENVRTEGVTLQGIVTVAIKVSVLRSLIYV